MKLINATPIIEKYKNYESFAGHPEFDMGQDVGILAVLNEIEEAPEIKTKPIIYAHWILEREPDGKPYCYHCFSL